MNSYGDLLFSIVAPMLSDMRDVEEVVQDSFIKAFSNINKYNPEAAAFQTWLGRIARHTVIDRLRKPGNRFQTIEISKEQETTFDDNGDEEPDIELLTQAINTLRGEERVIINLIYYDNLSPGATAEILEITPAILSSRLYRIKKKLARIIHELKR